MKDLNMLNEAFDNMFKNISESEAFNEDFDTEYAEMMNEIDNDSETMYKMYTSSGTISPADALYTLGYKDVPNEDALMSVINKNGTEYIKYFEFDYDDSYVYYVLKDGVIPRGWTATKASLSNSEVNESVEILNEKIPKDLAKAYTASGNTQWAHKDGDFINKVDYENSEYTEITPEQALELKKEGNLSKLRAVVDGQLVTYYNDGTSNDYIQYLNTKNKYTTRTGRDEYNTKYIPLKHILNIADKLYTADEVTVDAQKMKDRLHLDDGNYRPDEIYGLPNNISSEREAQLELGKKRSNNSISDFGTWEANQLERTKNRLAEIENLWNEGSITRQDYEKRKDLYLKDIADLESKKAKSEQDKRNKRASARNFASNVDATSALRTFKRLKAEMKSAESCVNRYQNKIDELKNNGANSPEFSYAKTQVSKLRFELADIKRKLAYYEEQLAKAENGEAIAQNEVEMNKYLQNMMDAQRELATLMNKRVKEESLTESAGGKWSDTAWEIINDMDNTTSLKKIAKDFVRWLSDRDVGEFLHQNGYVEYEDEE